MDRAGIKKISKFVFMSFNNNKPVMEELNGRGKKRKQLSPEEKEQRAAQRKQKSEETKRLKKEENELLKSLWKLDPMPQRKIVTINDKQLFQCTYTGIPCKVAYTIPFANPSANLTEYKQEQLKGCFLNPSVALRWVKETQNESKDYYINLITSDVKIRGSDNKVKIAPDRNLLDIYDGEMSLEEYLEDCTTEYISNSGLLLSIEDHLRRKQAKKSSKPKPKSSSKSAKAVVLDGITMTVREMDFDDFAVVAVPVPPQKVKDQLLKTVPEQVDNIPLLKECQKVIPSGSVIILFDGHKKDQVKEFKSWVESKAKK